MKEIRGGITAPLGFLAAGIHAGIKKASVPDLALVVSLQEGSIAGVFTKNRVAAAPVLLDRLHLRHGIGRAIIINSGNANACTGARGLTDAKEMAGLVARRVGTAPRSVFVGSTGVIGQPLPMACLRRGIPTLVKRLRRSGGAEAARAILTTDTKAKQIAVRTRIAGRLVSVGGMAKGSGMIHPDMATMLAYLATDVAIEQRTLQRALLAAVARSFNCISIDGDTSTNDTVRCLGKMRTGVGSWLPSGAPVSVSIRTSSSWRLKGSRSSRKGRVWVRWPSEGLHRSCAGRSSPSWRISVKVRPPHGCGPQISPM